VCAVRSLHVWYLWRMPEMDAPRALVFRPLVKGNEALGTRLVYIREFGYYILFGACRNEGNHFQTTKHNQTYLQEHNLQKNNTISLQQAK